MTGPNNGTYPSTGLYDRDTGLPVFETAEGKYATLENGNTPVRSPYRIDGEPTVTVNDANGLDFEGQALRACKIPKNTRTFDVPNGEGGITPTIPDGYVATPGGTGVTEIKSDRYLTNSSQLDAQMDLATREGLPFNLIISSNTTVVRPLLRRIEVLPHGGPVRVYDPSTRQIAPFRGNP